MESDYASPFGLRRASPTGSLTREQLADELRCAPTLIDQFVQHRLIRPGANGMFGVSVLQSIRSNDVALAMMRKHANPAPQYAALDRAVWLSAQDIAVGLVHPRDANRRIDPAIVEDLMKTGAIESRVCEATGERLATRAAFRNFAGLHREGMTVIKARQLKADDDATLARVAGEKRVKSTSHLTAEASVTANAEWRRRTGRPAQTVDEGGNIVDV